MIMNKMGLDMVVMVEIFFLKYLAYIWNPFLVIILVMYDMIRSCLISIRIE